MLPHPSISQFCPFPNKFNLNSIFFASPPLNFPILFISNPLNSNSNILAFPHLDSQFCLLPTFKNSISNILSSPHLAFPILFISNPLNSNSNILSSPHLDFPILLISNPLNSNSTFLPPHTLVSRFCLFQTFCSPFILFDFEFKYLNDFILSNRGKFPKFQVFPKLSPP